MITKKIVRKSVPFVVAATISLSLSIPTFAVGWQHNVTGWWYGTNETNTTWHANCWQWIDGNNDGIAECYYFDQNGYMLASTTTPDGFTVNADGAWTVNGVVQTKIVANTSSGTPSVGGSGVAGSSGGAGGSGASGSSGSGTSTSSTDTSGYVKFEDIDWKVKEPKHRHDGELVKYLGVYEGNNRGTIFKQEFAVLSDGTLCIPDRKYDSYKRVSDNTWGYFAGNVEDYMIMDENGNISQHFYINDAKNKGIDRGGIIYTKLSE